MRSGRGSEEDPRPLCAQTMRDFDYDWLVIGSGFGGSTSALRLAEKGYRVAVLECERRFADGGASTRCRQPGGG